MRRTAPPPGRSCPGNGVLHPAGSPGALYVADREGIHAGWQATKACCGGSIGAWKTSSTSTPRFPRKPSSWTSCRRGDSLINRGVDDVLDEGYTTPERWSVAQGFGNTVAEMHQGETIEQRIRQEQPEASPWMLPPGTLRGRNARLDGREAGRSDAGSGVRS